MENYEINQDTLAIIPKNKKTCIVYEKDNEYIIDNSALKVMENSCEYFGSTLSGRQKGATSLINITHKVPVIVEESNEIIFFPTSSPRLDECGWISLNNIKGINRTNNGCKINFKEGKEININASYGSINNQILRSSLLHLELKSRKDKKN